jgi:hypothetical protein
VSEQKNQATTSHGNQPPQFQLALSTSSSDDDDDDDDDDDSSSSSDSDSDDGDFAPEKNLLSLSLMEEEEKEETFVPVSWTGNRYEIEDDDDNGDDEENSTTSDHRSRRKGAMSTRERRNHSVRFSIERMFESLENQVCWEQIKSDFHHVQQCVNQLSLYSAGMTNQPLVVNNGMCRARWKTGGQFYSCSKWTLQEDTKTFKIIFHDDGTERNVPFDEIQLPRTRAPVEFWELCHRLEGTFASAETSGSSRKKWSKKIKLSKRNAKVRNFR